MITYRRVCITPRVTVRRPLQANAVAVGPIVALAKELSSGGMSLRRYPLRLQSAVT